ncbi:NAD-dependent epimerase/dehydratase family protein [Clavibacter capsici]|uniref:NAD-dependent epimerase/dehydratase family protein n=1 Tax=Clavibacter capsici TaxID=1874630 RepID=A0AAE6XT66_9MICO|nr:NAD-dependent epimerase/dehydratase family protein [Clavibacter capsici]ALD13894.1 NmrA family transcriptional regulator [Clavibacter capsici]QIS46130.1 NAD-dependent epimerase/dehydratase family protein [Clavibacter capsici]
MILVTGATGQLGSAILQHLRATGADAIGSSRSGADGMRRIDLDDPATVSFAGVDTLVLVSAGEAEDDVVTARHDAAITAAERDGVGHVIYTSVGAGGDHLAFALAHRWTERRLARSRVPSTVLRNGLYAELFGALLTWRGSRLESAFGDGALAAVARGDLAEAAAVVARAPQDHAGRRYDLVGRPITAASVAQRVGAPLDGLDLAARRASYEGAGLKPFQPAMLMSIHTAVRHGFLAETSGDLAMLLGRDPVDAVQVAADAASAARPAPERPAD